MAVIRQTVWLPHRWPFNTKPSAHKAVLPCSPPPNSSSLHLWHAGQPAAGAAGARHVAPTAQAHDASTSAAGRRIQGS